MARVMAAMRRAILPMSIKRRPDSKSSAIAGMRNVFFVDFLPCKKNNPAVKMSTIMKTAGSSFIRIV